jgi:hypothetical protein
MALAHRLLMAGTMMTKTKKLSLRSETLRELSTAELDNANGGTSLWTFTCVCFNVGGNAPGINVQRPAPAPTPRPPRR